MFKAAALPLRRALRLPGCHGPHADCLRLSTPSSRRTPLIPCHALRLARGGVKTEIVVAAAGVVLGSIVRHTSFSEFLAFCGLNDGQVLLDRGHFGTGSKPFSSPAATVSPDDI